MDISEILNHLGEDRDAYFNAVSPPIIQSSNFAFKDIQEFKQKIQNEFTSHIYTRGNNPTVEILRKKIAALEKTEDCLVVSSGASAISAAIISRIKSGDHIVCVEKPYSWTHKLLTKFLPRFNISHTFVKGTSNAEIEAAVRQNTTVLMLESPNSLTFELQDLRWCAQFAKANGITTIIDNSHASPYFQNPASFGIDIVVHSATKYLCGHSDVVMGVICSNRSIIEEIFHSEYMTLGLNVSPNDAFLALRGLRTLEIRMLRTDASCKEIFNYLKSNDQVRKVYYPLDPEGGQFELAQSQMRGNGGLISFELNTDSKTAVEAFSKALKHFLIAVSWGGHESLQIPSLAFYDIPGWPQPPVPFQTFRLYIGLENPQLLIEDLQQAFESIKNL